MNSTVDFVEYVLCSMYIFRADGLIYENFGCPGTVSSSRLTADKISQKYITLLIVILLQ